MVSAVRTPFSPGGRKTSEIVRRMGIGPVRFTVQDALEMVQQGILPEDSTVELLDGELFYRDRFDLRGDEIVEGSKHNYVVAALGDLRSRINDARRHLRTQSTLICSDTHAPIPDGVVLRGTLADYRDRLPSAADAFSVIEVADSSYDRDSGEKLTGYARAAIQQYVILNLLNRTAEVYSDPHSSDGTYAAHEILAENQSFSLRVGDDEYLAIALTELLP